ncbi:amino acid adenylation domain-containing protein [Streptomyces sp. NPDC017529]|uniref:amino acid adenylation domain-containing protein n=1 Tax=Streptomyces sp. NPDC017529 TaxID=3365000 RepID=UPI0037A8627B
MTGTGSARKIEDILPLSPLQEGLLFHSLFDESAADVYTAQLVVELEGAVDAAALRAAADAVLRRHASLRAALRRRKSGEWVQLVSRTVETPWREIDLSALSEAERGLKLTRLLDEDRWARFDLGRPPLIRFTLVRLSAESFRLVVTNHHVILDGWSLPILMRDLLTLYTAGDQAALPPAPLYRNYVRWLEAQDREAGLRAWADACEGFGEPTLLVPSAGSRVPTAPEEIEFELDEPAGRALADRARELGVTLNTVVQAAWGLLLGKLTGRDDVMFGATVSGRPAEVADSGDMVGLFINTLPRRIRIRPAETLAAFIGRVQAEQTPLLAHPYLGLADIQRAVGLGGDLFDTLLVFENYPLDAARSTEIAAAAGLRVKGLHRKDSTHYPVTLDVIPRETLRFRLSYQPGLVTAGAAQALAGRLRTVLGAVTDDPGMPVAAVDVLTDAERTRVLHEWNDTAAEPSAVTFPQVFEERARIAPDDTAVVFRDAALTFAELNARANRLARHLVAHGAGPERRVCLALPRSLDMVVALLATMKAGAAYVPVDPDLPAERLSFLLTDADPVLTLVSGAGGELPGDTPRLRLDAPETEAAVAGLADTDLGDDERHGPLRPDHLAYVIYTSGSTGRPKGVLIDHRGLANLFDNHEAHLIRPTAEALGRVRFALTAVFSFDTSWEGLLFLAAGHELHVIDDETRMDPDALVDYVATRRIDMLDVTPSYARQLTPAGLLTDPRHRPAGLMLGGEGAGEALWRELNEAPDTTGYNFYGPTECTVDALSCRTADFEKPAVGKPVRNTAAYVLDSTLNPVPPGVPGELYLAGRQLARGYLGRAALTSERFVANPYGPPGSRLYRTGDVVSRREDGDLEYHGRSDDQVKIRGFRIEPGEVEAAITAQPEVGEAVVTAVDEGGAGKRLVAYLIPADEEKPVNTGLLRKRLEAELPDHMVPAALMVLDAFPLTANGKLDRRRLPAPEFGPATIGRGPRNPREEVLTGLFAETLRLPRVGIDDDFFALGGDSILSMQLVGKARRAGLALSVRQVFENRTVARVAEVVEEKGDGADVDAADVGVGALPLLPIVHALVEQGGAFGEYNQALAVQVPAELGWDHARAAVQVVLDHHDALRMRLVRQSGAGWALFVDPPGSVTADSCLSRVDAAGLDAARLRALMTEEGIAARRSLSPGEGRMVRLVWFDRGRDTPGQLLLVLHHLVVDGVSWRVLLPDLAEAWEAVAAGRPARPQPVGTSLRRWAQRLVDLAADPARQGELPMWSGMLAAREDRVGDRALDPAVDTYGTAGRLSLTLPAGTTEDLLTTLPSRYHAGVDDVLLTAFAMAVCEWRGTGTSALLELEGHGRTEDAVPGADLARTVGWFTSAHPVRLDLGVFDHGEAWAGGPAAGQLLKRVKETIRAIPDDGLGYGLLRYLNPETRDALAAHPAPEFGFNYLGRLATPEATDWNVVPGTVGVVPTEDAMPLAHAVELNARTTDGERGPELVADWTWARGLVSEQRIRALAETWFRALEALAEHARRPDAGGFTQSDVPLVSLSQDELDTLRTEWGTLS